MNLSWLDVYSPNQDLRTMGPFTKIVRTEGTEGVS